jgi:trehalose 2-sulfotransferase
MYPRTSYIIYAIPRSGSFLLCNALAQTRVAGNPTEYFGIDFIKYYTKQWHISLRNADTLELGEDYFQHMYTTATPNGVFGFKIICYTFPYFFEQLRLLEGNERLSPPELIQSKFPHHRAILTIRRDKVRQAISTSKALQTEQWMKLKGAPEKEIPTPVFDFEDIERHLRDIAAAEQEIELFFFACGIEPFQVVYEDFVNAREETTLQILDYLEIPVPKDFVLAESRFQKQADEQTEEWVQRYYQIKQEQEMRVSVLQRN